MSGSGRADLPDLPTTGVVVVTRSPDADFPSRLERVRRNGACAVVVDNRSDPPELDRIREACHRSSVDLIANPTNLGLATGLNQGFEWAASRGMRWVIAFDQDSEPERQLFPLYRQAFQEYGEGRPIAMIGATFPPLERKEARGRDWMEAKTIITSGTLHSLAAYGAVGPFRDDFFIDCIDHEYTIRARTRGFAVLKSLVAPLRHRLGEPADHRLLGRVIKVSNHSPLRRYYRFRNTTVLAKAYLREDPAWILQLLWRQARSLLFAVLLEDDKRAKLAHAARGLADGLRGRMGPIPG